MVSFKKETKNERKIRKEDEALDKFLDSCVNKKYGSYYPIEKCIQDKDTPNKKKHSMCTYCYSCYVELCESIKEGFNININNNGEWTSDCLEKICLRTICKTNVTNNETIMLVKRNTESIINILNKYTKYSFVPKEGYNLLHREFIESIMGSLDYILNTYDFFELTEYKLIHKHQFKQYLTFNLNLFCFDAYCAYCFFKYKCVTESKYKMYFMIYEKNRSLSLLNNK